ncbi:hypothetical protein JK364_51890 [Streptomyces sp. 110]|uniref:Lipoprotein n=1 Tax=Streptomyces endocoffeicus TaxID=2898945 RepID=A0ABS1Q7Q8_9ACTN|nr:hypothetical protein [Streptomyces endocoffeicus]MBL1120708.1 hypothetical protein [Streptomyces endocoffeicus]
MTGCGGGGRSETGPSVTTALAKGVNTGCGHYLKPETVAAALGDNEFADVNGHFQGGKGSCLVNISVRAAGGGTSGPPHTFAKLSLEILDEEDPAQMAEYVGGKCHATSADGVTETFKGPKGACGTYRADPPEEFLAGGRVEAYAGEGRKLITVTVDGVDGTLKQDRKHALQLLADDRAKISGK